MGQDTNIEWCDHSWSPWRGCTKVSAGCANCYAETLANRFNRQGQVTWGGWGKGKPRVKAKNWNEPLKWNLALNRSLCAECNSEKISNGVCCVDRMPRNSQTVFPSLCDWLDEEVPVEWLAEFLELVHATPNLTWLLLTKRPENFKTRLAEVLADKLNGPQWDAWSFVDDWITGESVPANVWIGTSVEDQANADRRIPHLLATPAAVRFVSAEPLLGLVSLASVTVGGAQSLYKANALTGDGFDGRRIDWLIVGGESGPGARPCNVEWIRSLVAQGKAAGVPTFVKQLGGFAISPETHITRLPFTHSKGGAPGEWPEDLRVRQFPAWGGAW